MPSAETQAWREAHLYNEEVDAVFRAYRSLLYIVFAAFAKETLAGSDSLVFAKALRDSSVPFPEARSSQNSLMPHSW